MRIGIVAAALTVAVLVAGATEGAAAVTGVLTIGTVSVSSWIYSSAETNGLIPFTAAAAPGDQIGAMVFNLTGCSAGTINLVITTTGGAGALLSSDSGASETVGNGGLSVVNGAINIVPPGRSLWNSCAVPGD